MAGILRGAIWWADLDPVVGHEQAGRRPVVVISDEKFNPSSGTVIAMALSSQPQKVGFPFSVELESSDLPLGHIRIEHHDVILPFETLPKCSPLREALRSLIAILERQRKTAS